MLLVFGAMTNSTLACSGEGPEQLFVRAQTMLSQQVANVHLKVELASLDIIPDSLYSNLKLVSDVYQPRVGFQVLACTPENTKAARRVIWFRPALKVPALVYLKNATRNQPLQGIPTGWKEIDLIKERVKFSDLVTEPLNTNAWLAESVKENQPVLIKHLKKSPMILKDQHIRVVAISDGVAVEVDAVALQFGQYMEKIAVRLSASKQTVYAQVIDKGTAKID